MTDDKRQQAALSRLVRQSRMSMLLGWVLSAVGSSLTEGSSPALVVLSSLPAAWVAFYSTLGNVEDMLSPLAVRLLGGLRPGRVLVACEVYDVVLLLGSLTAFSLGIPIGGVLAAYLVAASPLPLVLDIVEEIYGAEMAEFDPEMSFRFTTHFYSVSALVNNVVSVPVGVALTFVSPVLVLVANLVLSLIAIALRYLGARAEERAVLLGGEVEQDAQDEELFASSTAALAFLLRRPAVSPLSVLGRSFCAALSGSYVLIYIGTAHGHDFYLWLMVCTGLGSALGPQLGRRLRAAVGTATTLRVLAAASAAASLGAALLLPARSGLYAGCLMLVLVQTASWALATSFVGERQVMLKGKQFLDATTWAQAAGALGGILGGWCALLLAANEDPRLSLLVCTGTFLALYLYLGRASGSPGTDQSDQTDQSAGTR